ncbi:ubiquinol-cytochrome C chaperone-domain-containing protein [Phyllosticta citribraziliensis]|uniref:Ubiquinol-cytochrome C chaperone-domain-containing protein n=1 Tax=Phyllosticta citribraziliensis TaxID=989973 RepID=A0ABR1LUY7_9PEZI
MASNFACKACRRALQRQSQIFAQTSRPAQRRAIATTASRAAKLTPEPPTSPAGLENNDGLSKQKALKDSPASKSPAPDLSSTSDSQSLSKRLAQELRKRSVSTTEPYAAYSGTKGMFESCAKQADYKIIRDKDGEAPTTEKGEELGVGEGWWYEELGLTPTFNTWAQVTFLHMYILTTRIRLFPAEHAPTWHQNLIDHFFYEAEKRMVKWHNIAASGIRNKYMHDLHIQWRGLVTAYDEGLVKGDAVLATALWRNMWKAEKIDPRGLAILVNYVRANVFKLDKSNDGMVLSGFEFDASALREPKLVDKESPWLKKPFEEETEEKEKKSN